jgi:hypothetical protein
VNCGRCGFIYQVLMGYFFATDCTNLHRLNLRKSVQSVATILTFVGAKAPLKPLILKTKFVFRP